MRPQILRFSPILKERIWGGTALSSHLNKPSTGQYMLGESWELSGVSGSESVVAEGEWKGRSISELMQIHGADLVGQRTFETYGTTFPLLFKFIDASEDLSIQVHPDDDMAMERHNSRGKTEMWYIMEAESDARIVMGLSEQINSVTDLKKVDRTNADTMFNTLPVKKGESFFIPAGQVHAIGKGILLAEIQQCSDITYRVYDWDRTDDHGNSRELHLEEAIQATKMDALAAYHRANQKVPQELLFQCPYFTTNKLMVSGAVRRDLSGIGSFLVYMCVEGTALLSVMGHTALVRKGETVLIPATADEVCIHGVSATLLEVSADTPPLAMSAAS